GYSTCLIVPLSICLMMAGFSMNSLGLIHPFSLFFCFSVSDRNPSLSLHKRGKLNFSFRSTLRKGTYDLPLIFEVTPRTAISCFDNPSPRLDTVGGAGTGVAGFPHAGGTRSSRRK
ncbi:hypothetical protein PMAYCL1PPCAC_12185, partial [Pristionchus mayeri]